MQSRRHMAYLGLVNRHSWTKSTICNVRALSSALKQRFVCFSPGYKSWQHFPLAEMPRYRGLAIFVWMVTTTDEQTNHCCTPCTCTRGNKRQVYRLLCAMYIAMFHCVCWKILVQAIQVCFSSYLQKLHVLETPNLFSSSSWRAMFGNGHLD